MNPITWEELKSRCYVPYSGRHDVCLVEGKSGTFYPGIRIENITFPLTIDALQIAIFSCISEGDIPSAVRFPEAYQKELSRNSENSIIDCHNISEWCDRYQLKMKFTSRLDDINPDHLFQTKEKSESCRRLQELTTRCHVPYSDFPVVSLLKTDKGFFSGVNIEISDWQKGLCSERIALGKARCSGASVFHKIYIYAPNSEYASPCGSCRQVLYEWMSNGVILLVHNETECTRLLVSELLPYQFKAVSLTNKHRSTKN